MGTDGNSGITNAIYIGIDIHKNLSFWEMRRGRWKGHQEKKSGGGGRIENEASTAAINFLMGNFICLFLCPLFNTASSAAPQIPLCRRMVRLNL